MIVVYSSVALKGAKVVPGARYCNPSRFLLPEPGATRVYLNGDFPKVQRAYERAGVPVERGLPKAPAAAPAPQPTTQAIQPVDTGQAPTPSED